jgi:hypothetical protein
MLCPFDFFSSWVRKKRFAFFAAAFLLMAPKLQAAQGTNGQLFVLSEGGDQDAALVLELPI